MIKSNVVGQRHWYGFALSLLTAFLWGVLPLFLKLCLESLDAVTITLFRFLIAGLFVYLVLSRKRELPKIFLLSKHKKWILLTASLLLVVNYLANVQGLDYISPETAQVVMQAAPFMLMLGGMYFYSEKLTALERFGAVLLIIGMFLFFNDRLMELVTSFSEFTLGVLLILFAAFTWAAYALLQKPILKVLSAKQLTLCIYVVGVLVLMPFANLTLLFKLDAIHWFALMFCCFNTIVGYGAFTEALAIWQASKVSAVITLAPIFTFLSMYVAVEFFPAYFEATELNFWAYVGAAVVVVGSALTSLGKSSPVKKA